MRTVTILALLLACDADDVCVGGRCECVDTEDCEFVCLEEPCAGVCESLTTCEGTCLDACDLRCNAATGCDFVCNDGCQVECTSVSQCLVDCGEGCDVDCSNLSTCRVAMVTGEARCASVADCDVECVLPSGGSAPAEDCGDGRFACGGC